MLIYIKRFFGFSLTPDEAKAAYINGLRVVAKKLRKEVDRQILTSAKQGKSCTNVYLCGYSDAVNDDVVNNLKSRGYKVTTFSSDRIIINW